MKVFSVEHTNFIKNRNPFTGKAYNTLFSPKPAVERLPTKVFLKLNF